MNLHYAKDFKAQLMNGTKIHTLRRRAVEPGMTIKHIIYPYHPDKRECVIESQCVSCQKIRIENDRRSLGIWIDERMLTIDGKVLLAKNDGFRSLNEFENFFREGFDGYIIHWTALRY